MMQRKIVPDIVERANIATMTADQSILDAAKAMAKKNIAEMIVVDSTPNIYGL